MTILRFLKSFSLVFPCRNEKPQTNFYILENNTISTYHELNLSRLWGIPRGKNVHWKIARKCDICILKYWLFPKAFRELQIKWNGSVLNLNHSSIPQTKICQIDTSLLSFALFMSWEGELLLTTSVPLTTVSLVAVPPGWNALDAELWLAEKAWDGWLWFLVVALFSSRGNN